MLDDQSWSFPGMSRFKFRVETAGNLFWKNFLWRPPSWQINFEIGTRQIGNHFSLNLVRGINSPPQKKHHFYPEKNPSALSSDSQRNASAFLNDDESMKSRACLPGMDRWPYPRVGETKMARVRSNTWVDEFSIIFKGPKGGVFLGAKRQRKTSP